MKKLIYFGILTMVVVLLAGCSSGPGAAAKKYTSYMKSGDFEKFADGIAIPEGATPEQAQQARQMMVGMLEKGKVFMDAKGGVDKIDVVSEEIAADGKTATVVLKITFKNGETEENRCKMVKQKSEWKMDIRTK